MGWIYATTIIAPMKDPKTIRNWTDVDFKRNPAGDAHATASAWSYPEHAIASVLYCASPQPALVQSANRDLGPEPLFQGELYHA